MQNPLEFETFPATDGGSFRELARKWAASVTVVTVLRRADAVASGAPMYDGFTATAFLTVSLDPPIVLVSATNASSALRMLGAADSFAVNLLSDTQQHIADAFAVHHGARGELFTDFSWAADPAGVPLLAGSLGAFSAQVRELIAAGDHTLCLGDVTALHLGAATEPLAYHNRRYVRVATER